VKKADLQIQVDRLREELADVRYGQAALLDGRTLTIEGAPIYLSVRVVVIGPKTEFRVGLKVAPAEGAESGLREPIIPAAPA
jgi:hypothetical protein